jgi:outer membrane immunogenic protein
MRKFVLAALMLSVVSSAHAADMPDLPFLRGSFTDAPVRATPIWQGYYIGGQYGYGSADIKPSSTINSDLQGTFIAPVSSYNWPKLGKGHDIRTGFGGFVGYNSQWDDVVVGVEANYFHGGFKATSSNIGYVYDNVTGATLTTASSSTSVAISDFGSLRARAGYAIGSFLPYAFVGGVVGSADIVRSVSASPAPIVPYTSVDTKSKLVYGYSAGVGVDVMLYASVFLRAEYEYARITGNIDTQINTVRAGVGYKF